jgi:putative membrane protein
MPFRYQHPGMGWGGGVVMLILFLIVIAAIVWVVFAVSRQGAHAHVHNHHTGASPATPTAAQTDALKILNERFARGEIDVEDYTKRRDLLKGPS